MAATNMIIKVDTEGVEAAEKKLEKLGYTVQKVAHNTNGTATVSGKLTSALQSQAGATDRVANATAQASLKQSNYIAHIAKTTILSAMVNKSFLALTDSIAKAAKQTDLIANFPAVMAALGVSSGAAAAGLGKLREYVAGIGGDLTEAAQAVSRFTQVNKDVKSSVALYAGVNTALRAGGFGAEAQTAALEQLSQGYARGKLEGEEFKSVNTAMGLAVSETAKALKQPSAQALQRAMTDGEISMNTFMATLAQVSTTTGPVANAALAQMQGIGFASAVMSNTLTNGLTAIYQAIGRQNIVAFFSFVTQVISVLAGWVVVLINSFIWLFNTISSLFGGPIISNMVGETADMAGNLGAGAAAAGDIGDGLDGAGKSAKKLNKQLAGFDKMNVLADKESASGGGKAKGVGGGAGGGGFNPGEVAKLGKIFDGLSTKMQEVSKWAKIFAGILLGLAASALLKKIFGVDVLDLFNKGLTRVFDFLTKLPSNIVNLAKNIGSTLTGWYATAKTAVANFGRSVVDKTRTAITEISVAWGILRPRIVEQFNLLKSNVLAILDKLGITEKFVSIRDAAVLVFQSMSTKISEAFGLVGSYVSTAFTSIRTSVTTALAPIIDTVASKFMLMKTYISTALSGTAGVAGTAMALLVVTVGDKLSALKDTISVPVIAAVEAVKTKFSELSTSAVSSIASMGASISSGFATYVVPVVGPIAKIGGDIGKGLIESLKISLGPIGTVASGIINGAKTVIGGAGGLLSSAFSKSMSAIGGVAKKAGTAISDKLTSSMKLGLFAIGSVITTALIGALKEGPGQMVEAFNSFIQAILNGPAAIASIVEAVKGMFATVAAQSGAIMEAVGQMIMTLVTAIRDNGPTMIQTFFDVVVKLISTLTAPATVTGLITGAVTMFEKIITGLSKILPAILTAMVGAVTKIIDVLAKPETIEMIITTAIDLLLSIIESIVSALPKILDAMIKLIVTLITVLTRPDILDKLINAGISLIITLALALIDAIPRLIVAAVQLIVALAKGLWDNRYLVFNKLKELGGKMVAELGKVDWSKMGTDLVKGLWNGIKNMGSWIGEKIQGFGKGVTDSLKNFFGIKSPSRMMRDEVGKMLGEGVGIGITLSTDDATDAAKKSSLAISKSFDIPAPSASYSLLSASNLMMDATGVASSLEGNIESVVSKLMNSDKPVHLTVQVGEEQIVNRVVDLINEKTQMSGRNTIYV